MKRTRLISAVLAAVVTLSGCSTGNSVELMSPLVTVSFSWWGNDVRNNYTIDALREFEAQNSDIDVIPEYGEWNGFGKRMNVEVSAGRQADVMQVNYDWLYRYSPDGEGFYDLNELTDIIDMENFSQEDLSYGTINGKLNGIPTALNAITFYYNKTIYDKYGIDIPKSWDDLFEAAKVMSADGVYPIEYNDKSIWLMCIAYAEQTTGKSFFDDSGDIAFTADDVSVMLGFYRSLVDNKVAKPHDSIAKSDFTNGVSAGTARWISDAESYCRPAEDNGYNIVIGDYPTVSDYKLYGWYAKPTSLYCIRKDTAEPEAAAKLLDFLLNSEEMASRQGLEKGIPLSSSTLEVLEANDKLNGLQYDANCKLSENSGKLARIDPHLEDPDVVTAFNSKLKEICYNDVDLQKASEELLSQLKSILE